MDRKENFIMILTIAFTNIAMVVCIIFFLVIASPIAADNPFFNHIAAVSCYLKSGMKIPLWEVERILKKHKTEQKTNYITGVSKIGEKEFKEFITMPVIDPNILRHEEEITKLSHQVGWLLKEMVIQKERKWYR